MKSLIIAVAAFVCVSANSRIINNVLTDTTKVVHEDIVYEVSQDRSNIYLAVQTSERQTIDRFLRFGITIYFDVKGKKKKEVYLKYPKRSEISKPKKLEELEEERPPLATRLEELPSEAMYGYNETIREFNVLINNLDIDASFSIREEDVLVYNIRIPKNKVSNTAKEDFSKMSIGIASGPINSPTYDLGKRPTKNARGGGKGGRGLKGNKSGENHNDQTNGKKRPGRSNKPEIPSVDFWFDADLKK